MRDREEKGAWIYGINPVAEAVKSGRMITALYVHEQSRGHKPVRKILDAAKAAGVPIKFEKKEFFESRFQKGHQGVAALTGKKKTISIEELLEIPASRNEPPFFIILDGIEDPRNFGAILRVADASGAHGVVFQSRRSAGITPVVAKASAGALEHVNLAEAVNIKHAMEKMKKADITIIGAEADTELTVWDVDLRAPLALVVGSEGEGLRRTVREMCDHIVRLPMKGTVNSLNVSVATGILSYEIMRQRNKRS
ncbi:MAG: 23S rRNA (guanosine(2251)-2'-O)-methyltransferase RlmB [Nitrospirota bacterium]